MSENSPIRAGFAAIHQKPVIIAIEIAWRWTFGLIATILLWMGARAFLAGLRVSPGEEQALRGHDPAMIAAALMHILQQGGVLQRVFGILAVVALPSAIIWVMAATLGRAATLRRLIPPASVNIRPILVFALARVLLLFAAILAWYAWMTVCAFITISGGAPNYPLYLLLAMLPLPLIAVIWGVLNWILSLAPVFAIVARDNAWAIYRDTVGLVRLHRRQFASVSTWLGLPRLAAMVVALMAAVVVLIATDSVVIGSTALTVITLGYCAFADYLYMVRLAACAQIARELPIATAATPL